VPELHNAQHKTAKTLRRKPERDVWSWHLADIQHADDIDDFLERLNPNLFLLL
jgi:hypothetical protein